MTALKSLKVNTWQKISASYSGTELKVYVNGVLKIKKAQTGTIRKNTNAITLGGLNSKLTPSAFSGNLDELKIYNLTLSDVEIKANYDNDVKVPVDTSLTTFTFNYANQLVKAVKGSSSSYFNYDAGSQRVSKITGVHTNLYPLGGFDYESSSDPATAFTKTNYTISGDGQTSIKETVSTKPLQSGLFYTHTDHLGSSAITTGVEGSTRQLVDYYPFGSSHFEQSWDNYANDYKYTGKEQDEEIGLYYYGARYYDAEVGRWVSVDPLVFTDFDKLVKLNELNSYAYVKNNPLMFIDTDGKFTIAIHDVIIKNAFANSGVSTGWKGLFMDNVIVGGTYLADYAGHLSDIHFDGKEGGEVQITWKILNAKIDSKIADLSAWEKTFGGNDAILFGKLLHTVQDFYSHSNYAELGTVSKLEAGYLKFLK